MGSGDQEVSRRPSGSLRGIREVSRAGCPRKKTEYDKAISDYAEAIRLNPNNAAIFANRGWAWLQEAEFDKAVADYTEAIRLNPKDSRAYCNRGWVQFQRGRLDKAIADCSEAIRREPKAVLAYQRRNGLPREGRKQEGDRRIFWKPSDSTRNPRWHTGAALLLFWARRDRQGDCGLF